MNNSYAGRKIQSNNRSGYPGIGWNKKIEKWDLTINYNYVNKYIGSFNDFKHARIVRSNVECACDIFKSVGVASFETLRNCNNVYLLLATIPNGNIPIQIEVSAHSISNQIIKEDIRTAYQVETPEEK